MFSVDTTLIFKQKSYDKLLIDDLYSNVQNQTAPMSIIYNLINDSFSTAYTRQVIFGVIFMAAMIVLIIPMCIILRKRFKTHERVFDLLSSIESEDVSKEIQSLLYICNILSNYNESQEKLKLNVLDY